MKIEELTNRSSNKFSRLDMITILEGAIAELKRMGII